MMRFESDMGNPIFVRPSGIDAVTAVMMVRPGQPPTPGVGLAAIYLAGNPHPLVVKGSPMAIADQIEADLAKRRAERERSSAANWADGYVRRLGELGHLEAPKCVGPG